MCSRSRFYSAEKMTCLHGEEHLCNKTVTATTITTMRHSVHGDYLEHMLTVKLSHCVCGDQHDPQSTKRNRFENLTQVI